MECRWFERGPICGAVPVVAEYEATRGPLPICAEHAAKALGIWPGAPLKWLSPASRGAEGGY